MKTESEMLQKIREDVARYPRKEYPGEPIACLAELGLEVAHGNGGPGGTIFAVGCAQTPERAASINRFLTELVENAAQIPGLKAQVAALTKRLEALEERSAGSNGHHMNFLPLTPRHTAEDHPGPLAD